MGIDDDGDGRLVDEAHIKVMAIKQIISRMRIMTGGSESWIMQGLDL